MILWDFFSVFFRSIQTFKIQNELTNINESLIHFGNFLEALKSP